MSGERRLAQGGEIDRKQPLRFRFNDRDYCGYAGDTLASALLANGVAIVNRSFKLHRPRGILGAGAEEPNAIVQIGSGDGHDLPNQRATQVELYEGLVACSINGWPSVEFDLLGVLDWLKRFLPAGFYYKTFMWPKSLWMRYEHAIRSVAGLGITPERADPDRYDKRFAHCDVLVVGAGPAGIAAALAAGRSGARVLLVDEERRFGGDLLRARETIDGAPAAAWLKRSLEELRALPEVTLLPRATAFGYYDHNLVAVLEKLSDHLPPGSTHAPRQRLWRVRAQRVVLATGAIERTLVFRDNDRPGVMLASAVSTYLHRYALRCGQRAVVFCNNDSAYRTALDLQQAGCVVAAIVDSRRNPDGAGARAARAAGIPLLDGSVVVATGGWQKLRSVRVARLQDGALVPGLETRIDCDLLAVSGGWSPAIHLHSHAGGRTRWDEQNACFVPDGTIQQQVSAGAAAGSFDLGSCLQQGFAAGAAMAQACGLAQGETPNWHVDTAAEEALQPLWLVPSSRAAHDARKFVDLQNDTTAADIQLAAREGYRSIEHAKRYTALGFGTDQGKTGNINGMAILAATLGKTIAETGTTTFRPAYTPVAFGAIAGADIGNLLDPIRHTPMHEWHLAHGARFENVGQWRRAWYYPRGEESLAQAVERECRATRASVGILDYSTLGKIDIQGEDAAEFLERVYTNAWKNLGIGRCRYGVMLGEDGMIFDDGVTTRLGEQQFLMTTTTGGAARVMSHLERWHQTEWPQLKVHMCSVSDQYATAVIAGPNCRTLLARICSDIDLAGSAFPFLSCREGHVADIPARVLRVSFSGELSFEIMVPASYGLALWQALIAAGKDLDITPYGTETMHVLRADKGFIIVGQDTDGSMTPQDMGMDWIVNWKKKDFIGRRSLRREYSSDAQRKQFVGLLTEDPAVVIPEGAQLLATPDHTIPAKMIGHVSSSYLSPSVERSIALALIKGGHARIGETVQAALADGRMVAASICKPLFYDIAGERQNV